MKRIFLFFAIAVLSVSSANAGWLSDLFTGRDSEPQTLSDACNIDEITAICPEIILGQKTLLECLTDNVKSVSKKCVDYVKRAVSENSPEIAQLQSQLTSASADAVENIQAAATDTGTQIHAQISDKIDSAKLEIAKKLIADVAENQ